MIQGAVGGNERTASFRGFHNHHAQAQAAEDPVAHGEMAGHVFRPPTRRILSALTVLELDRIVAQESGKRFSLLVALK